MHRPLDRRVQPPLLRGSLRRRRLRAGVADGAAGRALLFAHAAGTAVNWDVHYGIDFVADDGTRHTDGVYVNHVDVSGFGGVWPSAGIAFLGNGVRDGRGVDPRTGSADAFSVGGGGFSDVRVHDAVVHDDGPTGILVTGNTFSGSVDNGTFANTNIRITRDVVRGIAFHDPARAALDAKMRGPLHVQGSESGVLVYDSQDVLVDHAKSLHDGLYGSGGAGFWVYRCDDVTIAHCESAFNRTAGRTDGDGFDLDGATTHSVVEYCYSHDNDGAGLALYEYKGFGHSAPDHRGNAYRFNVSENDGRRNGYGAISVFNPNAENNLAHDRVYHNTVYLSPVSSGPQPVAVLVDGELHDLAIRDNIFYAAEGGGGAVAFVHGGGKNHLTAANVLFQRNDYWSSGATPTTPFVWDNLAYASLAAWEQTGEELLNGAPQALDVNPGLAAPGHGGTLGNSTTATAGFLDGLNAYRLVPGSALIGAALALSQFGTDVGKYDFYSNPLPPAAGYSLGADQP